MPENAAPGSATPDQHASIRRHAERSKTSWRHVVGLAQDQRNRTNAALRAATRAPQPLLAAVSELSRDEAEAVRAELKAAAREGRPARSVCMRCARMGFVVNGSCQHDRGQTDRAAAIAEREERRGLRSW